MEPFLITLYEQTSEHHREQTKQANQVVTFFLVFLAFFLNYQDNLWENTNILFTHMTYLAVIIVSRIVITLLIQLRVWQLQYAGCLQLIGSMFTCNGYIENYVDFNKFIKEFEAVSKSKHSLYKSITTKIIWVCALLSAYPVMAYYFYLSKLYGGFRIGKFTLDSILKATFFIGILILYTSFFLSFKKHINDILNKGEKIWLINYSDSKKIV